MDDFQGLLARDFGLRPQGKSAPMAGSRSAGPSAAGSAWPKPRSEPSAFADLGVGGGSAAPAYDDVFGRSASSKPAAAGNSSASLDSIFDGFQEQPKSASVSLPVFDKPVYDDDIFDGVPGVKSSSVKYDDVFASMSGNNHAAAAPAYDDLLGGFGRKSQPEAKAGEKKSEEVGFDDLIPGFGGSNPTPMTTKREPADINQKKSTIPTSKRTDNMVDDPFVVLETTSTSAHSTSGIFTDPLEDLGRPRNSEGKKVDNSAVEGVFFEESNIFDSAPKSDPLCTSEVNDNLKDRNPLNKARDSSPTQSFAKRNPPQKSSVDDFENIVPEVQSAKFSDIHVNSGVRNSEKYSGNVMDDQSPRSNESEDDVWLTVSEIPLFTQPTSAPPPSRPPPPLNIKQKTVGAKVKRKDDDYVRQSSQNYSHYRDSPKHTGVSSIDELEDFAMGKPQKFADDNADGLNAEDEFERSSSAAASAAAMKEAMDKAEAKFKHAKEVRERERDAKLRSREMEQQEQDEEARSYAHDLEEKERQERLEREREVRQREEKEREQRRIEKERELEQQRERERARQAVERATKEARERAAAEARSKAEREARQRAERAAVQRAQQEARERAATDAKERAERAAAEARERAAAEAKDRAAAERAAVERAQQEARKRAERAAVERAAAEARERQAAEARERHAAATREKESKPDDLESFFGMGARANSAPKQRAPTAESMFDSQTQSRGAADGAHRTASASASMRKASSTTNIVDDLSAIFGGAPSSSGEFQEIEGESEERRRARLERHQRTLERAAKALAEKNERDMQVQRDQAERHRIAETLDFEIKRWAAGKEGNLRALLSTLQYVLWPECGWTAVSLTDLITAVAVKKQYRKATLCIHPDKVQQKGATLQQKYIAEKVFDLLKEAWNKFNSEELF